MTHRTIAVLLFLHLIGVVAMLRRRRAEEAPIVVRTAAIALGMVVLQLALASTMILLTLPAVLRSLHEATGIGIWLSCFLLAYLARRTAPAAAGVAVDARAELQRSYAARSGHRTVTDAVAITGERSIWRDLVALTKPRIISLLLVTTIAPMFVAGHPAWTLVLAVFAGGYLMAGGANAVNMYIDRDIDDRMARTRLRPIPSGRMHPRQVLAFGVLLSTAATWLLAYAANVLTAALALAGFYFYVFIYTRWLKRSTPQNIVIGGAAGAFPPLVGLGRRDEPDRSARGVPVLIVFYWTPPHFWALALLKQRDYDRAHVPMAPLVWGERETKRQMFWYTIVLLPLTLLPVAFGALGLVYLIAASALGAKFIVEVLRVMRATEWNAPAWRLYKYSLLYLALLFAAMVVDRLVARDIPAAV